MRSKFLQLAGALLLIASPSAMALGEAPDAWLKEMEKALENTSFRGTFVYIHDDKAETMLVYHRAGKPGESGPRERLVSLNGSAREVLRDDDEIKCVLPDDKMVLVEKRHAPDTLARGLPLNASRYADYYEFELLGEGRIAGHGARMLAIKPRDGFRYGYRLWLEEKTALPLRSELVNEAGFPVEKMMFTEIEIGGPIDDAMLELSGIGEDYTWHVRGGEQDADVRESVPLAFESLPPGYAVTRSEVHLESERPSWHVVLSDGLASVSVFAEPLEEGKPALAGLSRLGAVNAFGLRLAQHHVTVVGEVPQATVAAIGEAVRYTGE
ncbi:MAG TPA: MucB/RseB C-terminal domain-containing protein [Gammaproteobacteria bacterium]|nr:MucB/RseB C-terminal domain-containing protein [Gammaproteobacteria bacterium]